MSASGFTPISLYYSSTGAAVPSAGNLVAGELALNTNDGKLYYKNSSGVVTLLAGATSGPAGGSTTQVQYNNAGVLAGSSALTWDGTSLSATKFAGALNGTVGATTPAAATVTTLTASADSSFTSTGAVKIPASTTGNRPAGTTGQIRYNTSLNTFEGYGAASWGSIGGGATGAGGDTVFQENQLIVTTSYTLSTGKSAMSVGPITINASVAVTVPSGYRWVII